MRVELPNGKIAEFPDTMTREQIQAVLAKQFGSPQKEAAPAISRRSSRLERKERRETEREQKLAQIAETNPMLSEEIGGMSPGKSLLLGAGGGFNELLAGAGITDIDEAERANFKALTDTNTAAAAGRFLGQAAPFAGAGGLVAGAMRGAPLLARVGAQGAIGATEGGLVAKGTGGKVKDIVMGATIGGVVGGAAEAVAPFIVRAARKLFTKVKGKPPAGAVIDDAGMPTPELKEALEESGESFDNLVAQAKQSAERARPTEITEQVVKGGRVGDAAAAARTIEADPARVAAAERLGVEAPIGVLTKDQATQELTGALAAIPDTQASTALDSFTGQLGRRADAFVEELGGATDRALVDGKLLDNMQSDISRIKAVEDQLYDRIRASIGDEEVIDAGAIKNLIAARGRTRQGVKNLSKVERDVYKMIKKGKKGEKGKLTYGQLNDMISDIGAAIGRETDAYSTVQSSKLSDMYSKLSSLRESVAGDFGQREALLKAKKIGAQRFGLQAATKAIYGKDLNRSIFPRIDTVIKRLDRGSVREFEAMMDLVPPKHRGPIAATMLNTALTGGRDASLGVNSGQFAKWYRNIERSPTAMKSLEKYVGAEGMARFDDIAQLAKGVAGVNRGRVRTGVQSEVMKKLDDINGITGKLYSAAQKIELMPGGNIVGKPVTAAANIAKTFTLEKTPAVEAADNILNSAAFKNAVISAKRSGIDSSAYKAASAKLKKTAAYKTYVRSLDETAAGSIAAAGLVPWLVSQDNAESNN